MTALVAYKLETQPCKTLGGGDRGALGSISSEGDDDHLELINSNKSDCPLFLVDTLQKPQEKYLPLVSLSSRMAGPAYVL